MHGDDADAPIIDLTPAVGHGSSSVVPADEVPDDAPTTDADQDVPGPILPPTPPPD